MGATHGQPQVRSPVCQKVVKPVCDDAGDVLDADGPDFEAVEVGLDPRLLEGVLEQQRQELEDREVGVALEAPQVVPDEGVEKLGELVNVPRMGGTRLKP